MSPAKRKRVKRPEMDALVSAYVALESKADDARTTLATPYAQRPGHETYRELLTTNAAQYDAVAAWLRSLIGYPTREESAASLARHAAERAARLKAEGRCEKCGHHDHTARGVLGCGAALEYDGLGPLTCVCGAA